MSRTVANNPARSFYAGEINRHVPSTASAGVVGGRRVVELGSIQMTDDDVAKARCRRMKRNAISACAKRDRRERHQKQKRTLVLGCSSSQSRVFTPLLGVLLLR